MPELLEGKHIIHSLISGIAFIYSLIVFFHLFWLTILTNLSREMMFPLHLHTLDIFPSRDQCYPASYMHVEKLSRSICYDKNLHTNIKIWAPWCWFNVIPSAYISPKDDWQIEAMPSSFRAVCLICLILNVWMLNDWRQLLRFRNTVFSLQILCLSS